MIGERNIHRSPIRAAVAKVAQFGVLVCGVVVAASACAQSECADQAGTHSMSPGGADSLVVSLDAVRQITGVDGLTSNPDGDDHRPHQPSSEPPGPCRVFDPQVAFGSNWIQFRSTVYNGLAYEPIPAAHEPGAMPPDSAGAAASLPSKPLMVGQTVGIYPNRNTANVTFERLVPALIECSALHAKYYEFTIHRPDKSTVVLNYGNDSKAMYHVKGPALINLSALGFPESERVMDTILQDITNRVK